MKLPIKHSVDRLRDVATDTLESGEQYLAAVVIEPIGHTARRDDFARNGILGGVIGGAISKYQAKKDSEHLGELAPANIQMGNHGAIVADIKGISDSLDGDVVGLWYLPYSQNANFLADDVTFIVHTATAPEGLQSAVRTALAQVDPDIAAYHFGTLERLLDDTYAEDRFALLLISLFGVLGLVLAAVGLYGLLAFQVVRRTREIGVRAALGAQGGDIVALVLRQAAGLVFAGLGAGLLAALALSRILQSQLHEVSSTDPAAYLLAALVLSIAALLACWLPARRASQVDPMVALRSE